MPVIVIFKNNLEPKSDKSAPTTSEQICSYKVKNFSYGTLNGLQMRAITKKSAWNF